MYFGLQGAPGIPAMDPSTYNTMGATTSFPNQPFRPPFCNVDNVGLSHQQPQHHHHHPNYHHQQPLNMFQAQPFPGFDVQSNSFPQLGVPWNHTVPPSVPWFQSDSPFPGGVPSCVGYADNERQLSELNLHCKRKGLHLDEAPTACKQHISEEAMALRMTQLNISGGNTCDNRTPLNDWDTSYTSLDANLEDFELKQQQHQPASLVVLAPELKKLESEPILPKSILEKLQKPTMELVLWKPPSGIIDEVIRATLSADASKDRKKATEEESQPTNESKMDEDVN